MSRPPARTRGLKQQGFQYQQAPQVASSREDAWIETGTEEKLGRLDEVASSREDAWIETGEILKSPELLRSRPPARTRGLKLIAESRNTAALVASSREDAWIETKKSLTKHPLSCRVLPRGRVD